MSLQALLAGEFRHILGHRVQSIGGIIEELGLLHEVVHAQGAGEPGGAGGGEGVVGTGKVVAQGFRAGPSQEHGAGVADGIEVGEGIVHQQLQMLRGQPVSDFDALHQRVRHDDHAVVVNGCPCDVPAGQGFQLGLQLRLDGLGQSHGLGDQDGGGVAVVLRLTEHVGGHDSGVALSVGQDQNLTGARDHVDGHHAEDLLLGLGNVGVAGSHDLVHLGDTFGAVGQGGHRLGSAHFENVGDTGDLRRRQNGGVDFSIRAGGRDHDDLLTARDFRGDGVHQHRGGVGGGAAGDIQAHPLDGGDALAQDHAAAGGQHQTLSDLGGVEFPDVGGGFLKDLQKFRLHLIHCLLDLLSRDGERIKLAPVKPGGIFENGLVAPLFHIRQNGGDGLLHPGDGGLPLENFSRVHLAEFVNSDHSCSSKARTRVRMASY